MSVGDDMFIGGQPTEKALRDLRAKGVTTVVNLRMPEEMARVGFDEAALVKELGIKYVHIPMRGTAENPYGPKQLDTFAAAMAAADGKVLLHCTIAWRASHLWAAYLIRERKMPVATALSQARMINLMDDMRMGTGISSRSRAFSGTRFRRWDIRNNCRFGFIVEGLARRCASVMPATLPFRSLRSRRDQRHPPRPAHPAAHARVLARLHPDARPRASAPTPRSSASSTACCCGRCPIPKPTASCTCGSRRSPPASRTPASRSPKSPTIAPRPNTIDQFVEFGDWTFNVLGRGEPHRAVGGLVTRQLLPDCWGRARTSDACCSLPTKGARRRRSRC